MRRWKLFTLAMGMALGLAWALGMGGRWADAASAQKGSQKPTPISHTARQPRPIQLGVSGGSIVDIANGWCCSGTLGALVKDTVGVQYILSNTHVFAGDTVSGGNGVVSTVGDPIDQPGYVDVQCKNIPADYVADLSTWIPLVPGGVGTVDAAIARVVPGMVATNGSILEIGTISSATAPAYLKQAVKKSGRTSGLTYGSVATLNATITVQYSTECGGESFVTTYNGQILVTPGKFLKAGDSGSLMVESVASNPRAVGLLYAGSNQVAVANPIDDVLTAFNVRLVGVAPSGSAQGAGTATAQAPGLAKASEAKAKHAEELMEVPGAVGHGVGLSSGQAPKAIIKVLVEQITPEAEKALPQEVDGIPVELMEVGQIVAY